MLYNKFYTISFGIVLVTILVNVFLIPFYISYTIQTFLGALLIYFMHTRFTFKGYTIQREKHSSTCSSE